MANIRKSRSQKMKVVSFSVKTADVEEFKDICTIKKLIPSHVVSELIVMFNKDNLNTNKL